MTPTEQAPTGRRAGWGSRLRGWGVLLAVAWLVGFSSRWISARELRRTEPAGFGAGVLHGAAMPIALPVLLVGQDPVIYASLNAGRRYKLGYTLGVNACGAVFFGLLYRRFNRRAGR